MNVRSPKIITVAALWLLMIAVNTASADVLYLKLDDQITPASAEVVVSAIARAERDNSAALIITLDTPGGLETSMREIVARIISSRVPVIVYVAPSGSRAASAGFVILLSADVAAMAPGTATGAARPVLIGGGEISKTMDEKIVNDASAYVRSLAEKRNRDPQVAELAIRESRSFTDREALDKRQIEIIARDEWDLLAQLNGRVVTRFDGSQKVLQTSNEKLTHIIPTFRQRLLMWLADPRIAFVLFAIGMLCVYFEFQHPGLIAPGVAGAVAMVLALYGFHMLPINVTGALLIAVALGLFVLEAKVQGFGLLGLGGVVAAVIGSLILIDVPNPELRLPLSLVLAVIIPFALILIVMVRLALRARGARVATGLAGMIGLKGRAETAIAPEGRVFVRGELWRARSQTKIAEGEDVRVLGVDGLTLDVDLAERDAAVAPKQASAIDEQ
ncbi:MAG: nodulation protein NfeD [Acidobacteria bacterium]|nr:nodulation protein NfeD [Acidobacteriota bacterium]